MRMSRRQKNDRAKMKQNCLLGADGIREGGEAEVLLAANGLSQPGAMRQEKNRDCAHSGSALQLL